MEFLLWFILFPIWITGFIAVIALGVRESRFVGYGFTDWTIVVLGAVSWPGMLLPLAIETYGQYWEQWEEEDEV